MARYNDVFRVLANRAVREGVIDIETFVERGMLHGMSAKAVESRLIADLDSGGPIFGKFVRSMSGAAASATLAASKQGEAVARAYAEKLISLSEYDDILDAADPAEMEDVAGGLAKTTLYMWVATSTNTCDRCLPLHGKILTMDEWAGLRDELGLDYDADPETIHDGWDSFCHCHLTPTDEIDDPNEVTAPLVRQRLESATGLKGQKRTQRSVAQRDIEKAIAAVAKAQENLEGRRTLRLMGQVDK